MAGTFALLLLIVWVLSGYVPPLPLPAVGLLVLEMASAARYCPVGERALLHGHERHHHLHALRRSLDRRLHRADRRGVA